MTREEAIKWFEDKLKEGKYSPNCPQCNAYELALNALRGQQPKEPLPLDELRKMLGHWVWIVVKYARGECQGWAFVAPGYLAFLEQRIPFNSYGFKAVAYRHRPEEDC